MKPTKHTPGPWRVGITKHAVYSTGKRERMVALCSDTMQRDTRGEILEEQANARLIAAAPELLALTARVAQVAEYSDKALVSYVREEVAHTARALLARLDEGTK